MNKEGDIESVIPKEVTTSSERDSSATPSGFVLKLFQMVNGAPDEIISWIPSGDAFRISDLRKLETLTLPKYFRHSRFQSLVRQLNFYNFRKVNRERTFWIYRHPLFHRDKPEDLPLLRRRTCPGADGRKNRDSFEDGSDEQRGSKNPRGKHRRRHISSDVSDDAKLTENENMRQSWVKSEHDMNCEGLTDHNTNSHDKLYVLAENNIVKRQFEHGQKQDHARTVELINIMTSTECNYTSPNQLVDTAMMKKRKRISGALLSGGIGEIDEISSEAQMNHGNKFCFSEETPDVQFGTQTTQDGSQCHYNSPSKCQSRMNTNEQNSSSELSPALIPSETNSESQTFIKDQGLENQYSTSHDGVYVYGVEPYLLCNSYSSTSTSKPPVTKRKLSIWPTSSAETTDDESHEDHEKGIKMKDKKRKAKLERMEQSLVVSQIAEQLEEYAKRAAEANGMRKIGRGRKPHGVGTSIMTPSNIGYGFYDTMRYNALTYDDEIYGQDDFDEKEIGGNGFSGTGRGAIVTDESDNSEVDDSPSNRLKSHGKHLSKTNENYNSAQKSLQSSLNTSKATSCRFHLPPGPNPNMIASINRKILQGLIGREGNKHLFLQKAEKQETSQHFAISSAIACFCMTTAPNDMHLNLRVENIIRRCRPLAVEFERYLSALTPTEDHKEAIFLHSQPDVDDRKNEFFKNNSFLWKYKGEFKTFVVNWMESFVIGRSAFTKEENEALRTCVTTWMESTLFEVL